MPKKRRNNGRNKKGRGNTRNLACDNCRKLVPKDKAIKRYVVRDLFDGSTKSDIQDHKAVEFSITQIEIAVPKLFIKQQYCVSCAIHKRIVRVRQTSERRYRGPPKSVVERRKQQRERQLEIQKKNLGGRT